MSESKKNFFANLFHSDKDSNVIEDEILSMVHEGHETGALQASEAKMIHNIFDFSDKDAKDIMTNRNNIVGIDGNTTLREAVSFVLSQSYSRYPVYLDNMDHLIGVLHLKDACRKLQNESNADKPIKSIRGLIRNIHYIPETRSIDNLFKAMQSLKTHFVIVVDEYGQTSGLLTMEDILEEIVGNIFDEYDKVETFIRPRGKDSYEIDGLTKLEDLADTLKIDFSNEEFETLNGLMVSKLEHIPNEDEEFEMDYDGYTFKVLAVENKVIKRVLVKKKPLEEGEI